MKNLSTLFLLFFLGLSTSSTIAQKAMSKGHIKYELTDVTTNNEEMGAMMGMMKGSTTEVYFDKTHSLTVVNMMGGMVQNKTLMTKDSKEIYMLMNAMGKKIKVKTSEEEQEKNKKETNPFEDANIVYDKNDTKTILGKKCYKVTITPKNMAEAPVTMVAYITDKVNIDESLLQGIKPGQIDGSPMEYTMLIKQQGMEMGMTYTVIEINKDLDQKIFDLKAESEEFTEMSLEEFSKNMGGMGGMGF